jgi:hypothetical protein
MFYGHSPLSHFSFHAALVKSNSHTRLGALVTPSKGLIEQLKFKGMGANEEYRFVSDGTIQ